jgi:hypothetical protein
MNVEIIQMGGKDQIIISILEMCRRTIPDLKADGNFTRLMKKLIRDRSFVLRFYSINFLVTAPLFVYYDLKEFLSYKINMLPINIDTVGNFESSNKFTELEDAAIVSIYKKIKSISSTMDNSKLLHILPMCSHVKFYMILSILDIYEILSKLLTNQNYNYKMKELATEILKKLHENEPDIFNEELLKIYQARS